MVSSHLVVAVDARYRDPQKKQQTFGRAAQQDYLQRKWSGIPQQITGSFWVVPCQSPQARSPGPRAQRLEVSTDESARLVALEAGADLIRASAPWKLGISVSKDSLGIHGYVLEAKL